MKKQRTKLNLENILIITCIIGLVLISFGIYLIGSRTFPDLGTNILIIGSGIFYFSTILLAFKL